MASRVYDELYAEYGRRPTQGEVIHRLEQKLGRDRPTASAEDATSSTCRTSSSRRPSGAGASGARAAQRARKSASPETPLSRSYENP